MVSIDTPTRGNVYLVETGFGPVQWLVVSNNARNARLPGVLCVRITNARRDLPAWVQLGAGEPVQGWVDGDGISLVSKGQIKSGQFLGTLSLEAMVKVGKALRAALAL